VVSNCPGSFNAPGGSASPTDTYIAAWDATTCPPSFILARADGSSNCGFAQSEVAFPATAGTTYYIQVGTWGFPSPNVGALSIAEVMPPANDDCAGAIPLVAGANGPFDNSLASASFPQGSCGLGSDLDLWFSYVAPCAGSLVLDTCGSPLFDTWISVWDNCPASAGVEIACNDQAGASGPCQFTGWSYVEVPVTAGNTYYINVGGWAGASGQFNLNVRCKYTHLWTVPSGPHSVQLENVDGPPFTLAYSAITADMLKTSVPPAQSFPNGWFYGLPMDIAFEIVPQLTWPGGAPFVTILDGAGYSLNLSLPTGTTASLSGWTVWSVGVAFDPLTGFSTVADTTDPTAFLL